MRLFRLFVPLTRDELDVLVAMANAERRRPQDQAAKIIAAALVIPDTGFVETSAAESPSDDREGGDHAGA
jgi:hypothetical protein